MPIATFDQCLKKATAGMKERVVQACADLRSTGASLSAR